MVAARQDHESSLDIAGGFPVADTPLLNSDEMLSSASITKLVSHELERVKVLMFNSLGTPDHWPATQASHYHLETGGSLLRARLALLSGLAFGASAVHRVAAATAVELIHNASLVHDDLCDADESRRGRPAVWKSHSPGIALCCGDLLLTAAFKTALSSDSEAHRLALVALITDNVSHVIGGQSIEMANTKDPHPARLSDYLQATLAKTAPLISLPLEAGAAGGHVSPEQRRTLTRFANAVGLAYQIIDDLDDTTEPHASSEDFHRYHALRCHWPVQTQAHPAPEQASMRRAAIHARAALARAERLLPGFPRLLANALQDVLATLRHRLDAHDASTR